MKNSFKWLIPVLLIFAVYSCKKSGTTDTPVVVPDTTVPLITLTDPTPGKSFVLGTALHLQMDLSDNVGLKTYKVVISKSLKGVGTSDWAYNSMEISIPAGKKTFAVNHSDIVVPLTGAGGNQTTTGNYDMTITCLDTSNNESSKSLTIALTK
jgi:hypothetical protein